MSLISTFTGSFHSAKTYREVRASGGFYMGYALVIVLLCTLAVTVYYTSVIHREFFAERPGKPILFDDAVRQIAAQMPTMTMQEHVLRSNTAEPTIIKINVDAFGHKLDDLELITIDTTGHTTHDTMKTPILVTDKDLIYRTSKETKIQSLADFDKDSKGVLIINRSLIDDSAERLIAWMHANLGKIYFVLGGISWLVFATFMYVMRMFMLLALGLVGLAIGSVRSKPITFSSAVGMASVSYTGVALLDTILFAGFQYPASTFTLFIAGGVALYAAIHCTERDVPPTVVL